jgi:hypothetical protein
MELNVAPKRKRGQRGPGKKPKMIHVTIRIPQETFEYYKHFAQPTVTMRVVLTDYAKRKQHLFNAVDTPE